MGMKFDRSIHAVLARNVRGLRERRGWTHNVLAERLGVGVPSIAAIESARLRNVRMGLVEAIARELGVEVVELLTPKTPRRKAGFERRAPRAKTKTSTGRAPGRRGC
jgi:XRE family transcriptional regulator, fatty acid utilization regulator